MTREEAERLAARGLGRWEDSVLVLCQLSQPLTHRGEALVFDTPSEPARFSWPGWSRAENGEWSRER